MNIFKLIRNHRKNINQNTSIVDDIKNNQKKTTLREWLLINELNHVYDEITKENVIHNTVIRDLEIRRNKLQITVFGDIQGAT